MGLRVCLYMALYSSFSPLRRLYPLKREEIEDEINKRIPFPKKIKEENLYHYSKGVFDWYWWGRGLHVYFEVEDEDKELIREHYERLWKKIIKKV